MQLAAPSFEDKAISNLENEILKEAIKKLSEKQKWRIMLRFYHDLTLQQIADSEKTSFQAISKGINAALNALKKIVENFFANKG